MGRARGTLHFLHGFTVSSSGSFSLLQIQNSRWKVIGQANKWGRACVLSQRRAAVLCMQPWSASDTAFHAPADSRWKAVTGMRKERLCAGRALNQDDLCELGTALCMMSVFLERNCPSSIFRGYMVWTVLWVRYAIPSPHWQPCVSSFILLIQHGARQWLNLTSNFPIRNCRALSAAMGIL